MGDEPGNPYGIDHFRHALKNYNNTSELGGLTWDDYPKVTERRRLPFIRKPTWVVVGPATELGELNQNLFDKHPSAGGRKQTYVEIRNVHPAVLQAYPYGPLELVQLFRRIGIGALIELVAAKLGTGPDLAPGDHQLAELAHNAFTDPATNRPYEDGICDAESLSELVMETGLFLRARLGQVHRFAEELADHRLPPSEPTAFPLRVTIAPDPHNPDLPNLVEIPNNFIDRALLELWDSDELGRCAFCGNVFAVQRQGQKYCPDSYCASKDYAKTYDKTDYRKRYQRMRMRNGRGTLTDEQWEQWKRDNKPGLEENQNGVNT